VHPDDREACTQQYLAAFAAHEDFTLEYRLLHHSGVHRWVLDCGIPRYASDSSFLGYVGGCIDITYRKEAEEKLRQMGVELIHAQETERQRIGQELHDDLAQRLSSLSMRLSGLAQNHTATKQFLREIEILRNQSVELCKDVSNLSHQLHPPTLLRLGLRPAIRNLCEQVNGHGVTVTYAIEDDLPSVSDEVSLSLYRVAQEALRNAQKHSQANSVHVELKSEGSCVSISVQDNGCGFMPGATLTHGLGLSSMADRTQRIGGSFSVSSSPGSGTTVTANAPIEIAARAASLSA
jgi:two-component system NarL family sensor kinase